jgi:hypothetical protein
MTHNPEEVPVDLCVPEGVQCHQHCPEPFTNNDPLLLHSSSARVLATTANWMSLLGLPALGALTQPTGIRIVAQFQVQVCLP